MKVRLEHVTKRFGSQPVLRDISLQIEPGERFFLLGPSGCGKTTLLRTLAGFYHPDEGELYFGDRRMNGIEPHHRNAGMVFQNYALWPHLSVAENVVYGLEVRSIPKPERERRVTEALRIVQMESFADRSPNQLSGGQQQRVALARALVVQPDVLLLDEPLSNLDARLRLEMRDELRRIHDQTRLTTLYVTHDQKEALSMADRMAVLRDGRIEQIGTPRQVYRHPANRFVADFIGEANWLPGVVQSHDPTHSSVSVQSPAGTISAGPLPSLPPPLTPVDVGFRPEAVRLSDTSSPGSIPATVRQVTYLGETDQYVLELPTGIRIKVIEQNPLASRSIGAPVYCQIAPSDCFLIPTGP